MTAHPTVVVIGAGVTGLSAARTIVKESPDTRVVVLEASDRAGGKLQTIEVGGVRVEAGADSFLVRDDDILQLCRELGLENDLIEPAIFRADVWRKGRLHPFPSGTVLGVPISRGVLRGTKLLSPLGRLRARADRWWPRPLKGEDVAVAKVVRRHFGKQVLTRLVDPILAGTRAGAVEEMSLAAAIPQVDAAAREGRSISRALRSGVTAPRFLTHREGLGSLVNALERDIYPAEVRRNSPVLELRRDGRRLQVAGPGIRIEADGVIVCTNAGVAAELLETLSPEAARELSEIGHASTASIALAYEASDIDPPKGSSGVLVPSDEGRDVSAVTWWSRKWPHTGPSDVFVARAFIGRSGEHPLLEADDTLVIEVAARGVAEILGRDLKHTDAVVTRWPLPQYRVGHLDRVARIEAALPHDPPVTIAGADLRGSGIPDCHRQGVGAARALLGRLHQTQG